MHTVAYVTAFGFWENYSARYRYLRHKIAQTLATAFFIEMQRTTVKIGVTTT